MTGQPRRVLAVYATLLAVVLCLATAAHAPHVGGVGVRGAGSVVRTGIEIAFVLMLICGAAVVLSLFVRRPRRRRPGDEEEQLAQTLQITRTDRALALLTALALLAAVIAVVFALARLQHAPAVHRTAAVQPPTERATTAAATSSAHRGGESNSSSDLVAAIVIGVLLLAAAGYGGSAWLHRGRHAGLVIPDAPPEDTGPGKLGQVLDDAAGALVSGSDPRAAIIACYRAMQRRLAEAGAAGTPADSPEELLDRASRAGLALPADAARLSELFGEARFSTHPMSSAQQRDAADALDRLRSKLAARR
jgi:hypothetical protein